MLGEPLYRPIISMAYGEVRATGARLRGGAAMAPLYLVHASTGRGISWAGTGLLDLEPSELAEPHSQLHPITYGPLLAT